MEKQERQSRVILFIAFLLTLISLGLLAAAMGSEYWVVADISKREAVPLDAQQIVVSSAHHGLFGGEAERDAFVARFGSYDLAINCNAAARICRYDALDRKTGQVSPSNGEYDNNISLSVFCQHRTQDTGYLLKPGEISFWLWIATVIFLSLAMLFGLIAAIFTMVNVLYVPISDIAGITGVYVWNTAAAMCTLVTLCVWSGLHYSHLRYNILPPSILSFDMTTCGLARHGLAVWLCLAALLLFLLNVLIIRLRRGARGIVSRQSALRVQHHKGEETLYY